MKLPSRGALAAGASLVLALVLRLWGIGFAPTAPRARPDEEIFMAKAFDRFAGDNALDILQSGWPEGFFRIVQLLQRLEGSVLGLFWHHPVNVACVYAINPGAVQLWPRVFSALIDVAGCLLVGLMVRRLARDDEKPLALSMGILALGCNYLAVRDAHFGVSDATLLFTICLCLYASVRAVMDGPRFLPLVAIAAGAGFGVKYAAAPMIVPCLWAFTSCLVRFKGKRWHTLGFGVLAVAAGVAAFHLASPGALANFHESWKAMVGQSGRYTDSARGHLLDQSWVVPPGWKFHLLSNLPVAFGWPALTLAIAGLGLCVRRDRHAGLLLIASALATFGMLVGIRALFVRYAAPVIPALSVGLGLLVTSALTQAWRRLPRPGALAAGGTLLLLAFAPPLYSIIRLDELLHGPDTRDLASRWLEAHDGGPAVTQGWYAQVHLLDPASLAACKPEVPPWLWRETPQLPPSSNGWRAAVRAGTKGWGVIAHNALEHYIWGTPGREGARYVVAGQGLLPCGKLGPGENHPPLDAPCYQLAEVISPGVLACDDYMDMYDAMWIPYRGFTGQTLQGPRIEIYENLCRKP